MFRNVIYLLFSLFFTSAVIAAQIPHLDPEMTGKEYRQLFEKLDKQQGFLRRINDTDPLKVMLTYGKRNLDWIDAINSKRDAGHKLELTTPETTRGIPIDKPKFSNRQIIKDKFAKVKENLPEEMKKVLLGSGAIPSTTSLDDKTFLDHAREMNLVYERASRWLLQEPYLMWYSMYAKNDIRGYYFLSKEKNLETKLRGWDDLDEGIKDKYQTWLVGECFNSNDEDHCKSELKRHIKKGKVYEYHQKYVTAAEKTYNDFFTLQNPRPEIRWSAKDPDIMKVPFKKPSRSDVETWFITNVEDEWRINDWALKINYSDEHHIPKIVFEAGTTPHADKLGGSTITMDANRNLNEYDTTWTIRHEFGHILGLPDCYVEFYDDDKEVMVNYQLDLTNLMCSRRGHFQQKHYDELKKFYFKKNNEVLS